MDYGIESSHALLYNSSALVDAAEVVEVPADPSLRIDQSALETLLQAHAGSRPVLGTFSAGSNVTGLREDVAGVTRLIHRYKGLVAWDAAAAAPHVASKELI
jgi:selenocysteine lyase/cysteine desulfurase